MFRLGKISIILVVLLLANINFLYAKPAFANETVQASNPVSNIREVQASNPDCKVSQAMATMAILALGAGIVLFGVAYVASFIPLIGTAVAIGSVVIGIGLIVGAILALPPFFVCNWSFVRHPVLRFGLNESGGKEKDYKECSDATYPSGVDAEFKDLDSYFEKFPGDSLDKKKQNEPQCESKKFKKANGYYWPKNRVSSSKYIEVCYRFPLGTGLIPIVLLKNIIGTEGGGLDNFFRNGSCNGTEGCPREADFGNDVLKRAKAYIRGPVKCIILKAGESDSINGVTFKAVEKNDKLCVNAVDSLKIPLWPQPEIGCHMRPAGPPAPMCDKSIPLREDGKENGKVIGYDNTKCVSWYISPACYGKTGGNSKSPFPVTAVVVECIKESLHLLMNGHGDNKGFLSVAQEKFKSAVMAVLVLALILFAIKAALGAVQHTAEIYLLVLKFAFVVYLTQTDVIQNKYYNWVISLSSGLSDIVLQAGGKESVCNYGVKNNKIDFSSDYSDQYKYLAPWDRLDCRMMFYLGSQLNYGTGGVILVTLLTGAMFLVALIFGGYQVLIGLMALFAVLMIVFIIIWSVYIFILSMIAVAILTLISPLMVPMMLFQVTKEFFNGWIRELITYSLYPVILFSFLSLVMTVFDNLYFDKLEFKRKDVQILDVKRITFVLKDQNACNNAENADNLACIVSKFGFTSKPVIFGIRVGTFDVKGDTGLIWGKLGIMGLIGFLFYHFLNVISSIAAELAGNPRAASLGQGDLNPASMMRKAISVGKMAASAATSGASAAAEKVKEMAQRVGAPKGGKSEDTAEGGSK